MVEALKPTNISNSSSIASSIHLETSKRKIQPNETEPHQVQLRARMRVFDAIFEGESPESSGALTFYLEHVESFGSRQQAVDQFNKTVEEATRTKKGKLKLVGEPVLMADLMEQQNYAFIEMAHSDSTPQ